MPLAGLFSGRPASGGSIFDSFTSLGFLPRRRDDAGSMAVTKKARARRAWGEMRKVQMGDCLG